MKTTATTMMISGIKKKSTMKTTATTVMISGIKTKSTMKTTETTQIISQMLGVFVGDHRLAK